MSVEAERRLTVRPPPSANDDARSVISHWSFKLFAAVAIIAVVGVGSLWHLAESRIKVVADDRNLYVHEIPAKRDEPVRYRLEGGNFEYVAWSPSGYVEIPLPASKRPERGQIEIDIEYRTMFGGFTRAKRVVFDADEEQLRGFRSGRGSAGWDGAFAIEGTRLLIQSENERCVRWRYGIDGESPTHDVPEHAKYIEIGSARSVTMKTNLCHRVRQCTVPVERGKPVEPLGDFSCL